MSVRAPVVLFALAMLWLAGPSFAATEAPEATWRVLPVAGDGWPGAARPGLVATSTPSNATDVAAVPGGGFLFSDASHRRVFEVRASGAIELVAGNGNRELTGDGGPAVAAGLGEIGAIAPLPGGGFVLADGPPVAEGLKPVHTRLRRVFADGTIATIAGGDEGGFAGDGGPATAARFGDVVALATTAAGAILVVDAGVADPSNQRVRAIGTDGVVVTVAGNGKAGYSGDGGPATDAAFQSPIDVAALGDGGFVVADAMNHRVRRVSPTGIVTTVAGNGLEGPTEDGRPATSTALDGPLAAEPSADGGLWIADRLRLRKLGSDGILRLVTSAPTCRHDDIAGPGTGIFAGDGERARCAAIVARALSATAEGGVLVADENATVRLVTPGGAGLAGAAITATRIGGDSIEVKYHTTLLGSARVDLIRRGQVLAAGAAVTAGGWGTVAIPRPIPTGVYRVRLEASTPGGAAAVDEVAIQLGQLAASTARRSLGHFFAGVSSTPVTFGRCHRFGPNRVDCERTFQTLRRGPVCTSVYAVQVRSSGLAAFRAYDCPLPGQPLFRIAPGWNVSEWPQRWPPMRRIGLIPAPLLPIGH